MPGLDFNSARRPTTETATEPRRIFASLPNKASKFGGYPRDVQSDVWERWHDRRDSRDLLVKMNTGSGKTVVGLILLKSSINEGYGPAVYLTPDNYLSGQVTAEAQALGIETTDDPRSSAFQTGRAILVVTVQRLINGLSAFGVSGSAASSRTPTQWVRFS